MATDVERLVVRLEASIKGYENAMNKAVGLTDKNARQIERRAQRMTDSVEQSLKSTAASIATGLAGALTVSTVAQYADAWVGAANKIKSAGLGEGATIAAREELADIAQRSRSDFTSIVDLYARLTRASKEFGATQGEVAVATETVAKALKLSDASAQEVQSTLTQLGQGLASGALQGDELRSLRENAPLVAQAIANEFNVAIGELKDLGAQGQLVADRVLKAIISAQPEIDSAFSKTNATIADSFKNLENAAIRFVGSSANVSTAAGALNGVLGLVTANFDKFALGAQALGLILASRLIGSGLTPVVAAFGAAASAATAAAGATAGVGVVATAAAGGVAALRAALALLGGPIGAAVFGVTAAVVLLNTRASEGKPLADAYAAALQKVEQRAAAATGPVTGLGSAVDSANQRFAAAAAGKLEETLLDIAGEAFKTTTQIESLIFQLEKFGSQGLGAEEKQAGLEIIQRGLDGNSEAAQRAAEEITRLGEVSPSFQKAFGQFSSLLKALSVVRQAAVDTSNAIRSIGGEAAANAAKAVDVKIPNPTASTKFDDDANLVKNDPVIRGLIGRGIAQRAVAESQADETKKKVDDTVKKLRDEIFAAGGTVDPQELQKQAGQIVAAGASGGGGGKGKGGGGAAGDFQKEIDGINRRRQELELEALSVGKSTFEVQKAKVEFDLLAAAKKNNIPVDEALRSSIDQTATAYANAAVKLEETKNSQEQLAEAQTLFKSATSQIFDSLIDGGQDLDDVLKNIAKSFAKAGIEALLFGSGPLGGAFGGGKGGGLFGSLLQGFGGARAAGGPVTGGKTYLVGEKGPELFTASRSGQIIPNNAIKSGSSGNSISFSTTIDARGADAAAVARIERSQLAMQQNFSKQVVAVNRQSEIRRVRA